MAYFCLPTIALNYPAFIREEIMEIVELAASFKETCVYREGLYDGHLEGRQEGRLEGQKEGHREGLREGARSLILRQLNRRLGTIAPELKVKIGALTIEQLEDLGEALLGFYHMTNLEAWLAQIQISVEAIIDLAITSMVHKFPELTRDEIMQVLELATEAKQTRFYQDVLQEGRAEEGRSLILRQLNRRLGTIAPEIKTKIEALTIVQLEDLGEALLDFASVTDFEVWLAKVAHEPAIKTP